MNMRMYIFVTQVHTIYRSRTVQSRQTRMNILYIYKHCKKKKSFKMQIHLSKILTIDDTDEH